MKTSLLFAVLGMVLANVTTCQRLDSKIGEYKRLERYCETLMRHCNEMKAITDEWHRIANEAIATCNRLLEDQRKSK